MFAEAPLPLQVMPHRFHTGRMSRPMMREAAISMKSLPSMADG